MAVATAAAAVITAAIMNQVHDSSVQLQLLSTESPTAIVCNLNYVVLQRATINSSVFAKYPDSVKCLLRVYQQTHGAQHQQLPASLSVIVKKILSKPKVTTLTSSNVANRLRDQHEVSVRMLLPAAVTSSVLLLTGVPSLCELMAPVYPDNGGVSLISIIASQQTKLFQASQYIKHASEAAIKPLVSPAAAAEATSSATRDAAPMSIERAIERLAALLEICLSIVAHINSMHDHNLRCFSLCSATAIYNPLLPDRSSRIQLFHHSMTSRFDVSAHELDDIRSTFPAMLPYLSPEQTGRANRSMDKRSDIYSIGVLLYELSSGRTPFTSLNPNHRSSDPFTDDDHSHIVHLHLAKAPARLKPIDIDWPAATVEQAAEVDYADDDQQQQQPQQHAVSYALDTLSLIINKCLAKQPEDRYQTARGVTVDLLHCQQLLLSVGDAAATTQLLQSFSLFQADSDGIFSVSKKLYGRDQHVVQLLQAFDRVNSKLRSATPIMPELVLISGLSGNGKTSIVNEVQVPITRQRGLFARGKFDMYQRHISCLLQAFTSLLQQLLTQSSERIMYWRGEVLAAVGTSGTALTIVLPLLEKLIGVQPELPDVSAADASNRFNATFIAFVSVFAREAHPLVLFIDDLQWADSMSLSLLRLLFQQPGFHLLIIGAYRSDEVEAESTHALTAFIIDCNSNSHTNMTYFITNSTQRSQSRLHTITVQPLTLPDLTMLLRDTLMRPRGRNDNQLHELAAHVAAVTQRNPFFVHQLLNAYNEAKLLLFDFSSRRWTWELVQLKAAPISDNVIALLCAQILHLSPQLQHALTVAACCGNTFSLNTLAIVMLPSVAHAATHHPQFVLQPASIATVALLLLPAVKLGVIQPLGVGFKLFSQSTSNTYSTDNHQQQEQQQQQQPYPLSMEFSSSQQQQTSDSTTVGETLLKWNHDKVQQACIALVSATERQLIALNIGRYLMSGSKSSIISSDNDSASSGASDKHDVSLFTIAGHMNNGLDMIIDVAEALIVIELDLQCAELARKSTAYEQSSNYLACALRLLPVVNTSVDVLWSSQYTIMMRLYHALAQSAYLCADAARSEELIAATLLRTAIPLDIALLLQIRLDIALQRSQLDVALIIATTALLGLGVDLLHSEYSEPNVEALTEAVIAMTPMTSAEHLAACSLIMSIQAVADGTGNMQLTRQLALVTINLCEQHGSTPHIVFALLSFALVLWSEGRNSECSVAGERAMSLFEAFGEKAKPFTARVYYLYYAHVYPWSHPIVFALPKLSEAIAVGIEYGDLEGSACCACAAAEICLYVDEESLASLQRRVQLLIQQYEKRQQVFAVLYLTCILRPIQQWQCLAEPRWLLLGREVSDSEFETDLLRRGNKRLIYMYFFLRSWRCLMSMVGNSSSYETVIADGELALQHATGVVGGWCNVICRGCIMYASCRVAPVLSVHSWQQRNSLSCQDDDDDTSSNNNNCMQQQTLTVEEIQSVNILLASSRRYLHDVHSYFVDRSDVMHDVSVAALSSMMQIEIGRVRVLSRGQLHLIPELLAEIESVIVTTKSSVSNKQQLPSYRLMTFSMFGTLLYELGLTGYSLSVLHQAFTIAMQWNNFFAAQQLQLRFPQFDFRGDSNRQQQSRSSSEDDSSSESSALSLSPTAAGLMSVDSNSSSSYDPFEVSDSAPVRFDSRVRQRKWQAKKSNRRSYRSNSVDSTYSITSATAASAAAASVSASASASAMFDSSSNELSHDTASAAIILLPAQQLKMAAAEPRLSITQRSGSAAATAANHRRKKETIDFQALFKASLSYAVEKNVTVLLERLMMVVLQYANASKGVLLLVDKVTTSEEEQLQMLQQRRQRSGSSSFVKANSSEQYKVSTVSCADVTDSTDSTAGSLAAAAARDHDTSSIRCWLPVSVFDVVAGTGDVVMLPLPRSPPTAVRPSLRSNSINNNNNSDHPRRQRQQQSHQKRAAAADIDLAADDFYSRNLDLLPKSLLALPIVLQQKLIGVLFLENTHIAGAFSSTHVQVLQLLCTQAASSIDNARLHQSLRLAKEVAEQATVSKANFLSNMSHEIRTPLNSVIGSSQLLCTTDMNAEQQQYVSMISTSSRLLLSIINDILDYSKLESGAVDFERLDHALIDDVESALFMTHQLAQQKGVDVGYCVDSALPHSVCSDGNRFQQVLLNLLSNAIKFVGEKKRNCGRVMLTVRLGPSQAAVAAADEQQQEDKLRSNPSSLVMRSRNINGFVHSPLLQLQTRTLQQHSADRVLIEVSVSDNGIGMSSATISRLFKPFSQGDSSVNRRFQGTGLGLAIVNKLIEGKVGEVSVTSAVGEGSCFSYRAELQVSKKQLQPLTPQPPLQSDGGEQQQPIPTFVLTSRSAMAQSLQSHCAFAATQQVNLAPAVIVDNTAALLQLATVAAAAIAFDAAIARSNSNNSHNSTSTIVHSLLVIIDSCDQHFDSMSEAASYVDDIGEQLAVACLSHQHNNSNTSNATRIKIIHMHRAYASSGSSTPVSAATPPMSPIMSPLISPQVNISSSRPRIGNANSNYSNNRGSVIVAVMDESRVSDVPAALTLFDSRSLLKPVARHHLVACIAVLLTPSLSTMSANRRDFISIARRGSYGTVSNNSNNNNSNGSIILNHININTNTHSLSDSGNSFCPNGSDSDSSSNFGNNNITGRYLTSPPPVLPMQTPVVRSRSLRGNISIISSSSSNSSSSHVRNILASAVSPAKKPLRILLAEDNIINQKLMTMFLSKLGYDPPAIAVNGGEVLRMLHGDLQQQQQQLPWDLILMDVSMEEMDGIECTKLIRQHELTCAYNCRSYICGQTASVNLRSECESAGMNNFITKPLTMSDIAKVLAMAQTYNLTRVERQ